MQMSQFHYYEGVDDAGSEPAPSFAMLNDQELALLHESLFVLASRFFRDRDPCAALWISRQMRLIADHGALPDRALRPFYLTLAARWHTLARNLLDGERQQPSGLEL